MNTDPIWRWLLALASESGVAASTPPDTLDVPAPTDSLYLIDESLPDAVCQALTRLPHTIVLTHRYDVAMILERMGMRVMLGAYASSAQALSTTGAVPGHWIMRLPKERALARHWINLAATHLPPGGRLSMLGRDKEGIRTAEKDARQRLGSTPQIERHGDIRQAQVIMAMPGEVLTDEQPGVLRVVSDALCPPLLSTPGIFAWDRLDRGSLLLQAVFEAATDLPTCPARVLDLGCGHGHLACLLADRFPAATVVATDSNSYAVLACQANLNRRQAQGRAVLDDVADSLEGPFDLVLCNPPFHKGFGIEGALTLRFLQATQRLLGTEGQALFVVNQFIPLGRLATPLFGRVTRLHQGDGFEIWQLAQAHRPQPAA